MIDSWLALSPYLHPSFIGQIEGDVQRNPYYYCSKREGGVSPGLPFTSHTSVISWAMGGALVCWCPSLLWRGRVFLFPNPRHYITNHSERSKGSVLTKLLPFYRILKQCHLHPFSLFFRKRITLAFVLIGHFTVMDGSEVDGDLVLIQTFLLYYVNQVILMLTSSFQEQFP